MKKPGCGLRAALPLLALGMCAWAEQPGEEDGSKREYRYEHIVVDGKHYVFDRKTGKAEPLALSGEPAAAKTGTPRRAFPEVVTEEVRKEYAAELNEYREQISLRQTLKVLAGRVSGTIEVRNRGGKRLEALELTLSLPAEEPGKVQEHRILMGRRPGQERPPEPAREGEPIPVYLPVDLASPAGRGRFDVRISLVRFAEE